jgi:hypothetical protein
MTSLTPIGGGHVALGAASDALGANSPSDPAATASDVVAAGAAPVVTAPNDVYINPQFQVDPQSGVVMLQYRDQSGKVVRQVPSEYELRSYHFGQDPGKTPSV